MFISVSKKKCLVNILWGHFWFAAVLVKRRSFLVVDLVKRRSLLRSCFNKKEELLLLSFLISKWEVRGKGNFDVFGRSLKNSVLSMSEHSALLWSCDSTLRRGFSIWQINYFVSNKKRGVAWQWYCSVVLWHNKAKKTSFLHRCFKFEL